MMQTDSWHGRRARPTGIRAPALGIAACACWLAGCAPFPDNARERLVAANRQYESGNVTAARGELDMILRDYPEAPESAEAYYLRGLCAMRSRDTTVASKDLEHCIRLSQRQDLTARAHATLGEIDFGAERYSAACGHFAAAIPGLSNDPALEETLYRYGVSLQRERRWSEARQQFELLEERYRGGRHREEVSRRRAWPAGVFAVQCGVFREQATADAMVRRLSAAGLAGRQSVEDRSGESVRVVYAGRYATYEQAKAALPAVRRIVPDAQVMP